MFGEICAVIKINIKNTNNESSTSAPGRKRI